MTEQPDALTLLRSLADDDRLRLVGLLALRPRDPADCALLLGITESAVEHHVRVLRRAGLVRRSSGLLVLDTKPLRAIMAATADRSEPSAMVPDDAAPERRRVLAAFFEGEQLVKIPSQRKKMLIVIERLAEMFAPDRTFDEKEVNEILRRHHPDVASLRRAMVDHGLLARRSGRYRRTPGPAEPPPSP